MIPYNDIIKKLEKLFLNNANEENQYQMEKYLRNQFSFYGIKKPERTKIEKKIVDETKNYNNDEIITLMQKIHIHNCKRELVYTAQQIGLKNVNKFTYENIEKIMELTLIDPWWENTDGYIGIIKRWLLKNPQYTEKFIKQYYKQKNFWLRRSSIICQLGHKEKTNFKLLKMAIESNQKDSEFFIQKAIGWSLRDYSKTNPQEVKEFVEEIELTGLAQKEALKYIINK